MAAPARRPVTASSARAYSVLRRRHYDAWVALFREFSEDAYEAWVAASEYAEWKRKTKLELDASEEEAKENADLEDWLRAGGLPKSTDPGEQK